MSYINTEFESEFHYIPDISLTITKTKVKVKPRKLKARCNVVSSDKLKEFHFSYDIIEAISNEIYKEELEKNPFFSEEEFMI